MLCWALLSALDSLTRLWPGSLAGVDWSRYRNKWGSYQCKKWMDSKAMKQISCSPAQLPMICLSVFGLPLYTTNLKATRLPNASTKRPALSATSTCRIWIQLCWVELDTFLQRSVPVWPTLMLYRLYHTIYLYNKLIYVNMTDKAFLSQSFYILTLMLSLQNLVKLIFLNIMLSIAVLFDILYI